MALKPEQYDAIRLLAQPKASRPTQCKSEMTECPPVDTE
jgi:hypothetical protein